MDAADTVKRELSQSGFRVKTDPADSGVLRVYRPSSMPVFDTLCGMVVVRDGFVTYAEHDGHTYAFWPRHGSHSATLRRYLLAARRSA
jgi:hypothetical protein